eukprot:scaffold29047_cov43-Cyclotella_meneghiniana.AAC.5
MAFVSYDRGSIGEDVLIENELSRNRALDGDYVFAVLLSDDNDDDGNVGSDVGKKCEVDVTLGRNGDEINDGESSYEDNFVYKEEEYVINEPTITTLSTTKDDKDINSNNMSTTQDSPEMCHDDQHMQCPSLWNKERGAMARSFDRFLPFRNSR